MVLSGVTHNAAVTGLCHFKQVCAHRFGVTTQNIYLEILIALSKDKKKSAGKKVNFIFYSNLTLIELCNRSIPLKRAFVRKSSP